MVHPPLSSISPPKYPAAATNPEATNIKIRYRHSPVRDIASLTTSLHMAKPIRRPNASSSSEELGNNSEASSRALNVFTIAFRPTTHYRSFRLFTRRHFPVIPSNSPIIFDLVGLSGFLFSCSLAFFSSPNAGIERILTIIGHVLGKIFVPAQPRTLCKREETFSAADSSTEEPSPETRLHEEPDRYLARSIEYLHLSVCWNGYSLSAKRRTIERLKKFLSVQ
jgi:hypothetical protein